MKLITSKILSTLALTLYLASPAQAALMSTSIGGGTNNAVYDSVLDITWLANANLSASNTFGVSGINANGTMTWTKANEWTTAMNADGGTGYLGVNTWRQPEVTPVNGSSFNTTTFTYDGSTDISYQLSAPIHATYNQSGQSAGSTASELAYHYYNNLGAIGACSGVGNSNTYGCVSSSIYGADDATNATILALFSDIKSSAY